MDRTTKDVFYGTVASTIRIRNIRIDAILFLPTLTLTASPTEVLQACAVDRILAKRCMNTLAGIRILEISLAAADCLTLAGAFVGIELSAFSAC